MFVSYVKSYVWKDVFTGFWKKKNTVTVWEKQSAIKQKYSLGNIGRIVPTLGCTWFVSSSSSCRFELFTVFGWLQWGGVSRPCLQCVSLYLWVEIRWWEDKCLVCVQAPCDNGSKIQNYILQWDEVVMPFQILHCWMCVLGGVAIACKSTVFTLW